MRKFINWASIAFVCILVYSILSNFITSIPSLPVDQWDIFPSLAVIAASISGYKLIKSKKYIELIDGGNIEHFTAIMAALEITDKDIYKIIMQDYRNHIIKKIDVLSTYIEDERCHSIEKLKNKYTLDFNIKEEISKLNHYKNLKNTFLNVQSGKTTWKEVNQKYINAREINYVEKYLLGELTDEEIEKIQKDVDIINKLRRGRIEVNI